MQTNTVHNFRDETNAGLPSFEVFIDGHLALRVTSDAPDGKGGTAGQSALHFYRKDGTEAITIDENNTGVGLDTEIDAHFENEFGEGAAAVMREAAGRAAAKLRTVYDVANATGMDREMIGQMLDDALADAGEAEA